ncbi:MAG TPA: tetratricopeptide repeat protein, partial [Desulfobulbaceae bacterium]|nr:tetratricopeptide repeat protein [Desulfobulbaceae bacterium]
GSEHPDTLMSVSNLAGLFHDKGEFEKAQPLYERALEARERVLGVEHPSTKIVRRNLEILFDTIRQ